MIPFPFQAGQLGVAASAPAAPVVTPRWDSATVSSPLALSVGDARLTLPVSNTGVAKTVRGSLPLTSGKWYWEVGIVDVIAGSGATTGAGIADSTFAYASQNLGGNSTANSGGLWLNGGLYFNGTPVSQGITFAAATTMMFALDIGSGALWVGKNGTWIGNPAAGTGASKTGLSTSATYYPAATPWSSSAGNAVVLDIKGQSNSIYPAPSGFTPYTQ